MCKSSHYGPCNNVQLPSEDDANFTLTTRYNANETHEIVPARIDPQRMQLTQDAVELNRPLFER